MRDHTANSGYLFTVANPTGAASIATNLMKEDSDPFKSGPDVITAMRKAAKDYKTIIGKRLGNGTSFPWIMSMSDYEKMK